MNDPDLEQRELLAAARRGLSPSSADAERVFAAVVEALRASPPAAPETSGEEGATQVAANGSVAPGLFSKLGGRVFTVLAVAGAAGSGYYAGFRAGLRERSGEAGRAVAAAAPSASARVLLAPATPFAVERGLSQEPLGVQPGGAREGKLAQRAGSASVPSASPRALSLQEEVRTLRRVERALRDQNPRLALALLGELEREVPQGQLGEERSAAEMMARCALGFGSPPLLAREFSERFPQSAYAPRVRQVCEGSPAARGPEPETKGPEK